MIVKNSTELFKFLNFFLPTDPLIIEAGSFNGSDTIKMIKTWPKAIIHAFEPLPDRFQQLKNTIINYPSIHCYPLALSNKIGTTSLYVAENPSRPGKQSQASSLLEPKDRLTLSPITFPTTIQVSTTTLNAWAKKHQIIQVDLLWLDLQGHELEVLKHAEPLLPFISYIYLEVSFIESYKEQPLYEEVIAWLNRKGFQEIGRDFENTTDHFFGNILVKKIT